MGRGELIFPHECLIYRIFFHITNLKIAKSLGILHSNSAHLAMYSVATAGPYERQLSMSESIILIDGPTIIYEWLCRVVTVEE